MSRISFVAAAAIVVGGAFAGLNAQTVRSITIDRPGRCAIPLVQFPARAGIDRMNVLPPGPAPKNAMPVVVPVPSCGRQGGELLAAAVPERIIIRQRRADYRRVVEYHPAPLPGVLEPR